MHDVNEQHFLFPGTLGIVKIVAPFEHRRDIIRAVEFAGYVQPIEVDPRPGVNEIEIEQRRIVLENYRSELQSLINVTKPFTLKSQKEKVPTDEQGTLEYIKGILENQGSKVKKLLEEKETVQKRIDELNQIKELLMQFKRLGLDASLLEISQKYTRIFVGSIFKDQLDTMNNYLIEITDGRYVLINNDPKQASKSGNVEFMAIVFIKDADAVETRLKELNYEPIKLPEDKNLSSKLEIDDVEANIAEKEQQIADIDNKIEETAKEVGYKLLAALEVCDLELNRIDVEFKMRRTKSTAVLWGWIPPEKFESFKSLVTTYTDGTAVIEYKESFDRKYMPTYAHNKAEKYLPVRGLVNSFGTPSTKEIDPFPFVAVFFGLFFGIMFADVGHGLLLLFAGLYFRNKRKQLDEIPKEGFGAYTYGGADLMIYMGIFSIVGGFFLGSFFGDETILWEVPLFKFLFSWSWEFFYSLHEVEDHGKKVIKVERNYLNFLIFSFAVGAITIIIGLGIKVYQQYYYRHSNFEMYATIALITLYISGIGAVVASLAGAPSILSTLLVITLAASFFGVLFFEGKAHGFDGAMEGIDHILSLLSNTFSFGRLLAMNTIHFVFSFLPYKFIELIFGVHIINHEVEHWRDTVGNDWPWWILGALIGAVIVMIVETVFSTLQALRLTWVEFFGKFYKGSGIPFVPVQVNRVYTTE